MKIKRAASIPLVTHDPYFSIWSPYDHAYDGSTEHWAGETNRLEGVLIVDGVKYAFLGEAGKNVIIEQKSISVTATSTEYVFENEKVVLKCKFTSPLVLSDLILTSRPCTYVDFEVEKKDATEVSVEFRMHADIVRQDEAEYALNYQSTYADFKYMFMGKAHQQPLGCSGDEVKIDWGYAYMATKEKEANFSFFSTAMFEYIRLNMPIETKASLILAYDDLCSINYFGQWRKGYWTTKYDSILEAIADAFNDKEETMAKAAKLDKDIEEKAMAIGGESYAFLCNMSYRQSIAAHKLIADEDGEIIFLSKENDSNGCIGTVDVSYPSIPLYLLYNTEYVKGMMRPIFKFASCDVWNYDFAPHDVGRYPYAWGQVYGASGRDGYGRLYYRKNQSIHAPYYLLGAESGIYKFESQMPVEECGNMLIMMAVVCKEDGNADYAKQHWDVLKQWTRYLVEFGADPGEQLCTDDFAGRLARNVNLSVKAIMGIESYAMLADMLGEQEEADKYHKLAQEMAASWEERAKADDHYMLAFGNPDTWSQKYNMVWDKIWGSNLFSQEVYEKELAYYEKKTNQYGTPLDSRTLYTKSDWILWTATMAKDKEQREKFIAPVARFLEETVNRVPFTDFYTTTTAMRCEFKARSVQGGIFMPMYAEKK